jgi:branched-chain amino acid transport system substrate-binding protein
MELNRKQRRYWRVATSALVVGAAAVVLAACGSSSSSSGSSGSSGSSSGGSIKVGVVGGLTSLFAFVGESQLSGVKIAAEEINAAGGVLGGKKFQVLSENDAGEPSRGISAMNKFASEHVAAIMGSPDTAGAVAPYAERVKTPLVGVVDEGGVNITPGGPGTTPRKWVFGTTTDSFSVAQKLGEYASLASTGCKKIAMLHDTTTNGIPGASATAAAIKKVNGPAVVVDDPVAENWASSATPGVAPEVRRVEDAGANCLIAWISPQSTAAFIKSAQSSGFKPKIIASDEVIAPEYGPLAGAAADGTVSVELAAISNPGPKLKAFNEAYSKSHGGKLPNNYGVESYDAMWVVSEAIKKANSSDPEKVREALNHIEYEGASGKIVLTPTNHSGIDPSLLEYTKFDFKKNSWVPLTVSK